MCLLTACGGDSHSKPSAPEIPSDSETDKDIVVSTYDDLFNCNDKNEGVIAYVKVEHIIYVCKKRRWEEYEDNKAKSSSFSSSSKSLSSSSNKVVESSSSAKTQSSSSVTSSSSISSSAKAQSSSSIVAKYSSSSSISSKPLSSSSSNVVKSSSSVKVQSSSSSISMSLSSSAMKLSSSSVSLVSSSSMAIPDGWSWDVPKKDRLNPAITYGSLTDSRDSKVYKTVVIGKQTWMAENLNYDDSVRTPSLKGKSWCFDNEPENCKVAGRLYVWSAAIDSVKLATAKNNPQNCGNGTTCKFPAKLQGICPNGWHLPDTTEWNTLFAAVGGVATLVFEKGIPAIRPVFKSTAGLYLKSLNGWYNNGNGSDAYGFSALPVGAKADGNGSFSGDGKCGFFWSSSELYEDQAYYTDLDYVNDSAVQFAFDKGMGVSVRCLKD